MFEPALTHAFVLVGHRSSGKTSLGDLLCATTGVTRVRGSVDAGTSLLDHAATERRRKASLAPSFAWMQWNEHVLELIDTPGSALLAHERDLAAWGADLHVVVVSASDGVEIGTVDALKASMGTPRIAVLNKMDRPHDHDAVLVELERAAGVKVLPLQVPLFDSLGRFAGVRDLIHQQTLRYDVEEASGAFSPEPLVRTADLEAAWEHIVEQVALTDDALLEQYLEYLELPREVVIDALAAAVRRGLILPLFYVSATKAVGAQPLLDALIALTPSAADGTTLVEEYDGTVEEVAHDGPFVAQLLSSQLDEDDELFHVLRVRCGTARGGAWVNGATGARTKVRKVYEIRGPRRAAARDAHAGTVIATWDPLQGQPGDTFTSGDRLTVPAPSVPPAMMAWLLEPASARDRMRLPKALQVITRMDRALQLHTDEVTGGVLLAGISSGHLERAVSTLRDRFDIDVRNDLPPVSYRETPAREVGGIEGVHEERDHYGLVAEFGKCEISVSPQPPDAGNRFVDDTEGDDLPRRYRPFIDEGGRIAMQHGPTAGYPVVGANVRLTGGDYNILSSEEDHFVKAGQAAVSHALEVAGTRLLEPWSKVSVFTPPEHVGDLLTDIASHRGRIVGMDVDGDRTVIRAMAPFRELRTFGSRLQALTHGRGTFEHAPSHYEALPDHLLSEAINASPYRNTQQRGDGNAVAGRRSNG